MASPILVTLMLIALQLSTATSATFEGSSDAVFEQRLIQPEGAACDCVATGTVLLHMTVCGPAVEHLTAGRHYRTLAASSVAPVIACGLSWTPLRIDGVVMWTADMRSAPSGDCDCRPEVPAEADGSMKLAFGNGAAPSAALINCICQVESHCNLRIGCVKDPVTLSCGPFQIKEAYWTDASQYARKPICGDWKTCTTGPSNAQCSWQAVLCYMARYGRYCTGGRDPTDEDYARIHNGGPKGCQRASTQIYWAKVKACMGK